MTKQNQQIVKDLIKTSPENVKEFSVWKRKVAKQYKLNMVKNAELIAEYKKMIKLKKIKADKKIESILKKRAVRTKSGVSVITVLTKPYMCPGSCVYCPSEKNMPKSYLSNEPAAQRAARLKFDPIKMVQLRIKALENNGHQVDKIELLVLGGSFTAYTPKYQQDFITQCFYAANTMRSKQIGKMRKIKSLAHEQKINEKAKYKIIGLTLETRPDEINEDVIKNFRELGCTRVQLGVQHTDDKILKLVNRGHGVQESIQATWLLKQNGFKVDHHYMPDLPGSTPAKDLAMMKKVFNHQDFKPDQIKIYPCVVNEYAELAKWFKNKKYKPYSAKQLFDLLIKIKKITPCWVRINRLIRDIPEESIMAGNKITNLRQYLAQAMIKQGDKCKCIRCREVGLKRPTFVPKGTTAGKAKLFIDKYQASHGTEYFISYESLNREVLYGFLRLRFNDNHAGVVFSVLKDAAIVRELHVYGQMIPVDDKTTSASQHKGLGKKLLKKAEQIAKQNKYKKIAVISGVGVRGYYRKLGYELEQTYLVKKLKG